MTRRRIVALQSEVARLKTSTAQEQESGD